MTGEDTKLLDWLDGRSVIYPSRHPDHPGETLLVAFLPIECPTLAAGEPHALRDLLRAGQAADPTNATFTPPTEALP